MILVGVHTPSGYPLTTSKLLKDFLQVSSVYVVIAELVTTASNEQKASMKWKADDSIVSK